jgi:photosystem II stability/assembly factor-like uncharacterized protein
MFYAPVTQKGTGFLYISTDYGQTWTQVSGLSGITFESVCCSASGQYQTAVSWGGVIYYSSNYGVS